MPAEIHFRLLAPHEGEIIRPLWEELRRHHADIPTPFADDIAARTFAPRWRGLCDKAAAGGLRVEIASTAPGGSAVAFCITSLSPERVGEVDSLFVSPVFRRAGIATTLLQRALDWLRESGAVSQRVIVLHANEEAIAFYRSFGFQPRNLELEIKNP